MGREFTDEMKGKVVHDSGSSAMPMETRKGAKSMDNTSIRGPKATYIDRVSKSTVKTKS